jgi:hypothetical protein
MAPADRNLISPLPARWATLTPFFRPGFRDTLDRLTAQNMKGISFLVERL